MGGINNIAVNNPMVLSLKGEVLDAKKAKPSQKYYAKVFYFKI